MSETSQNPRPELDERFRRALALAYEVHRGQARKTAPHEPPGPSYLGHLLGVAAIVIDARGDEDQAIAALLHDAVEDQGGLPMLERIRDEFGDRVAKLVRDCSDWLGDGQKPPWIERKRGYIAHLGEADPDALLVSLADKLYNARAIALDLERDGDRVWERFNAGGPQVVDYYQRLAERFEELLPGPLASELRRVADGLAERSAAVT